MKLKQIDIKGTTKYKFYEIPNAAPEKLLLASYQGKYLTLVGFEEGRRLWFRLGDRKDLVPKELKDFKVYSYRGSDAKGQEAFINSVIERYKLA